MGHPNVVSLVLLGSVACSAAVPAPTPTADAFVGGVPLIVGPAENAAAPCGLARDYKIGGRIDPPVRSADGTWTIVGCFYSHGNELRNTELVLTFDPDPEGDVLLQVFPIQALVSAEHREVSFTKSVRRARVDGLRAYLAMYVRAGG